MKRLLTDRLRLTIFVSLITASAGIVVQILGGWEYPPVPPGMIILLVGGLAALIPNRWAPVLTLLVGTFIIVGYVTVDDFANMLGSENGAITIGKWVQFIAVVVGSLGAVASLVRPPGHLASRAAK